jgi:hypothetical protein
MHFRKSGKGIGIGGAADADEFQVYMSSRFKGGVVFESGGWENLPAMTRESDTSFSCAVDLTGVLGKADKIKWVQNGVTKYAYVENVGAYSGGKTIVTINAGTDFVVTNGQAVTAGYYSHVENPVGFPQRFNFNLGWHTASGTQPSIGNGSITAYFSIHANICHVTFQVTGGSTTVWGSDNVPWRWYFPVGAKAQYARFIKVFDPGIMGYFVTCDISTTKIQTNNWLGGLANSPSYQMINNWIMKNYPFAWGSGDQFGMDIEYPWF